MLGMYFYQRAGVMALGSRLRRLGEILGAEAESVYRDYGVDLDPRWFPAFYTLTQKGEASITELAGDIGQSHASVSQVVRQMRSAGLLQARNDPGDSRRTLVCLTGAARDVAERLMLQCADVETAVRELLAGIDVDFWGSVRSIEEELEHAGLADRVRAVRKRRESAGVDIVPFNRSHGAAFKALNLAWIRQHWEPEPADFEALDHPQARIIDQGGYIAIAVQDGTVVGTCALLKMDDTTYELAKMAVADAAKGRGIGEQLGKAVIAEARRREARRVYLESNTVLEPAINLYRKLGFVRVARQPSPYQRCNIQMELLLQD